MRPRQTSRTPQRWQILAPRLQQSHKLSRKNRHYTRTPIEVLFEGQDKPWDAWSKLAKPVDFSLLGQSAPLPKSRYGAKTTASSRSSLEYMPAELLKMVFDDETLEKHDIVALGLCSRSLWQHMLERVESAYRKSAAPWAGTEIACTGTNLTDLPESFEKDNLAIDLATYKRRRWVMLARRFNWSAWREFKPPKESQLDTWRSALQVHRKTSAIPESCWPRLEDDVSCTKLFPKVFAKDFPKLSPKRHGWVLRNLDKKEYVRICASSEHKGEHVVDDSNAQWLRLDDVLIMRICWTWTGSHRVDFEPSMDLHRGKWAGHRFDVVMLEDSLAATGGWKDITEEIVSEARKLRREIRTGRRLID